MRGFGGTFITGKPAGEGSGAVPGTGASGTDGQLACGPSLILQTALCCGGFRLGLAFFRAVS